MAEARATAEEAAAATARVVQVKVAVAALEAVRAAAVGVAAVRVALVAALKEAGTGCLAAADAAQYREGTAAAASDLQSSIRCTRIQERR